MDVTIAVATFGDFHWRQLAQKRAIPSAEEQGVCVVQHHGDSLEDARNEALAQVETEWVIFLDADDELEPGYVEAMGCGQADVRGPLARYVTRSGRERDWQPRVAGHTHTCSRDCLPYGNWLLIGSAVRTQMVHNVGGWRGFEWSEDWDLWLRCYKAGASFELIPDAIYRAHVRPDSRNRSATRATRLAAHSAIYAANFNQDAAA